MLVVTTIGGAAVCAGISFSLCSALGDIVPISGRQFIAAHVAGDEMNPLGEQRAAALMSRIDRLESIVSMRDFWKF
ncbi:hypothetical protein [Bradyrhizobium erythrophlei]|uniref:hypothetical protein n=1 Tax=Bradyrhizobium erythrophlei TaxID=1437360 RepID=UPI0009A58274|nr:hypothetical protein [Bradyrhizobium erythrophlei]